MISGSLWNYYRDKVNYVANENNFRMKNICEIEFDLLWSKYYIISEISRTSRAVSNTDLVEYEVVTQTTRATFQINNVTLYVPVVTLSINVNIKFLGNTKQGFKRKISWNKCRSKITKNQKSIIHII